VISKCERLIQLRRIFVSEEVGLRTAFPKSSIPTAIQYCENVICNIPCCRTYKMLKRTVLSSESNNTSATISPSSFFAIMNHVGNRQLDGSLSISSSYSISMTKEELDATMARYKLQLTMAQREAEMEDLHKIFLKGDLRRFFFGAIVVEESRQAVGQIKGGLCTR
jgi:hypothetical protein